MANVAVRDTTVPTACRCAVTLIHHIDVGSHLGASGRRGDGRCGSGDRPTTRPFAPKSEIQGALLLQWEDGCKKCPFR